MFRLLRLIIISACVLSAACAAQKSEPEKVRPPAVAGSFYPADAAQLTSSVDAFLASAKPPDIGGQLVALVAPHAGYPFSGPVAGYSYALLKGRKFARVVVIAPSHYDAFNFASVYDGDFYSTPLGRIAVDKSFARKLAESSPALKLSSRAHVDSREHSLEVQLPFLQRTVGDFKLVPVVMGAQDYDSSRALGVALAKLIQDHDTLIVASSDLSHFHPYDEAAKLDHKTLNALTVWDYLSASRNFERRVWEACGGAPIVAAMIAAERLGATDVRLLKYANSGDVTADRSRVVGYGALAMVRAPGSDAAGAATFSLSSREREELLKLAHKSVETAVKDKKLYDAPSPAFDNLAQERGAFVTLKEKGHLRGCIGYTSAFNPLYLTVRDVAAFAAVRDSRFAPVRAFELPELEYEISVLSPLRRVTDVKQIQVGRHGLLMKNGHYEGILLPQVPTELGWDRKTFLEETCEKAGMQRNCWQDADTDIFMFTALVFEEHKLAPSSIFDDRRPPMPEKPDPHSPPR